MGRLEGKNAIVTGAASGIGRACAKMFAKEGATVVATDLNAADDMVAEVEQAGGRIFFIQTDLSKHEGADKLYGFAVEKIGKIDVLMNCAGVLVHKPFLEHTDADFDFIMKLDLQAYIWNMQNVIPNMVENGGGSIVNVASISAFWPETDAYFYGCAKAAVANLSVNVAKEFAKQHVRINVIEPGPVTTNMTPKDVMASKEIQKDMCENVAILGRLGDPDDIAYAAVYLASDESSWVTAAALPVDGGVHICN